MGISGLIGLKKAAPTHHPSKQGRMVLPWGDIPAQPFLMLQEDDKSVIFSHSSKPGKQDKPLDWQYLPPVLYAPLLLVVAFEVGVGGGGRGNG